MANDAETINHHAEPSPLENNSRLTDIMKELRLARANIGEFFSHVAHDVMEHKPVEHRLAELRNNLQKNSVGLKDHSADSEPSAANMPTETLAQQSSKIAARART